MFSRFQGVQHMFYEVDRLVSITVIVPKGYVVHAPSTNLSMSRLTSRPAVFILFAALLVTMLVLSGCSSTGEETDPATETASVTGSGDPEVTEEYAALNGSTTPDGQQYLDVSLPDDHVFSTITEDEVVAMLQQGTGVLYFGFPECPWCRAALPVMDEAGKNTDVGQIHYLNVSEIRDVRTLDEDGTVVVEEPGSEAYLEILAELGEVAPEYEGLGDPEQRRIYVPLVVAVKDGEVLGSHVSTVDSQTDPFEPMTEDQRAELRGIYEDLFAEVALDTQVR